LLPLPFPRRRAPIGARPRLEALEDRWLPTVTYHGGPVLAHVEVQALYYGSAWYASANPQAAYLEGFLNSIVNSSYMDMMYTAGYGVGRGSFSPGFIDPVNLPAGSAVSQTTLEQEIQRLANLHILHNPDANTLYVVFVQPNVLVQYGNGRNSANYVGALHTAFWGNDVAGRQQFIPYALVAYPAGATSNIRDGDYILGHENDFDTLTEAASHEFAEACTDPTPYANINGVSAWGWTDENSSLGNEIGDLANQTVYLNGYAVVRLADQNDQPMTPAGAVSAGQPISFVLQSNGQLHEHSASGWSQLMSGVASLSDQGIEDFGRAMVDFVTTTGAAYEYSDLLGSRFLANNVVSAKAGVGVSYVLFKDGTVWEFSDDAADSGANPWTPLTGSITAIDAGTDRYGVNMVDVLRSDGVAFEHSDTSGWRTLAGGVQSIHAGFQGYSTVLLKSGAAYLFSEGAAAAGGNGFTYLAGSVAAVTVGSDPTGGYQIELLFSNGAAYEFQQRTQSWSYLGGGVINVSRARIGLADILFSGGFDVQHPVLVLTFGGTIAAG
jgi:hypothetical protein